MDHLNILSFSNGVKVWPESRVTRGMISHELSNESKNDIRNIVFGFRAQGGTNINEALLESLSIAQKVNKNEEIEEKAQQMIIFLTDGEATSGVTNKSQACGLRPASK